ncbi:MAG: SAM-dependent methyltransferase [Pseudomonadota bacterium]
MSVGNIIDKKQVVANVLRAKAAQIAGSDFLLERLVGDLEDRLDAHTRRFDNGLVVSPWAKHKAFMPIAATSAAESIWRNEVLAAEPQSVELIIDMANLHRINDVPGMLVQYLRALKPDGLFLACVPGGDTLHELRESLTVAESELTNGVHPRILPFMDVRDAGGLLQRAGFALPVTDVDSVVVRYDTMFNLMLDLRSMGETNVLVAREKCFARVALFERAAEYYQEKFSDEDGRVRATFSFVWMSGWAPAASQQKPLKPGSATHSLADVLKGQTS